LKTEVEDQIAAVRGLLDGGDAAAIRSAVDVLSASLSKIGEQVYAQQQAEATAGGAEEAERADEAAPSDGEDNDSSDGDDGDETVEGEFREV